LRGRRYVSDRRISCAVDTNTELIRLTEIPRHLKSMYVHCMLENFIIILRSHSEKAESTWTKDDSRHHTLNGILATLGVLNPTVSAFYPDRV
jgi:hypothetical protein